MVGRLYGVGVGPGDPELVTLKALRLIRAAPVIAFPVAKGRRSNALAIVEEYLSPDQIHLPMVYPVTTEKLAPPDDYEAIIADFYDEVARLVAGHLDAGRDVAVLCEGDPFFYGSYMYLHLRLAHLYETVVVPGVCSMLASASVLGAPLVFRNQMLSVISGVLDKEALTRRLGTCEAAVIMKLGSNFAKVLGVLNDLNLTARALYIERATMGNQRIVPITAVDPKCVPYFSMILIPGAWSVPSTTSAN